MANNSDSLEILRKLKVEVTGDIVVPGVRSLGTVSSVEALPDGTTARGRMPEYRGNFDRSRFGTSGTINDGNKASIDEYDNLIPRWDKATGSYQSEQKLNPLNAEDLHIPASTSNVSRPRTLAAGYRLYVGERAKDYADQKGTLTVLFRDGTFYNYYNVPPGVWIQYKTAISKGFMVNRENQYQGSDGVLLNYPHGRADISELDPQLQSYVYRVARSSQLASKAGRKRNVWVGDKEKGRNVRTSGYVPTSASRRVGSVGKSKGKGSNPAASNGTNPATAGRPKKR